MRSTNEDRVNVSIKALLCFFIQRKLLLLLRKVVILVKLQVRLRSAAELEIFQERWTAAVNDDQCWKDPYPEKIQ